MWFIYIVYIFVVKGVIYRYNIEVVSKQLAYLPK